MIRGRTETDTVNPAGQVPSGVAPYPRYIHGPARPSTASRSILKLGDYVDHVKASEERTERLNEPYNHQRFRDASLYVNMARLALKDMGMSQEDSFNWIKTWASGAGDGGE